jgi:hypothetical protein
MDVLRRRAAEGESQLPVQRLVRAVVVAADDMRDPELEVVDDARQVVRSRPVGPEQRDPAEALAAQALGGLAVRVLTLALAHRPLVPRDPEPLEVADERLLPAGHVSRRVRVVDPEQHPVS